MKRPADLTVLQAKSGGEFPYKKTFAIIDGRYIVPGHGNRDMPTWDDSFSRKMPRLSGPWEAVTEARIHELAEYIAFCRGPIERTASHSRSAARVGAKITSDPQQRRRRPGR